MPPNYMNYLTRIDPANLQPQQQSGFSQFLQTPGLREGLLQTGLALLAQKDQRGSLGGALGRALPYGIEAGRQAAARQNQEDALDELFADAPPQMQALRRVDPSLALRALMAPPPERNIQEGREGEFFEFGPTGGVSQLTTAPTEPVDRTGEMRTAMELVGLDPGGPLPNERRQEVIDMMEQMRTAGASRINVGTERDITDLPQAVQSQVVGSGPALLALDRYEEAAKNYLNRSWFDRAKGRMGVPNPERDQAVGELQAIQNTVLLQVKNLAELGVLNGPDKEIVTELIGDPLSLEAIYRDPQYVLTRIEEARRFINDKVGALGAAYNITTSGGTDLDARYGIVR